MRRIVSNRPSPAMAVAVIALLVAMSGTAVAAGHLVSGDKLIKRGSLSGNRLRPHTITGAQIDLGRLGTVPTAATAALADSLPALNWVPLQLMNGWSDARSPDARVPAMAVDAQGIVHLRGVITSAGSSDVFAVAPQQFRPSQSVDMVVPLKFNAIGVVDIATDGTMTVTDPSHGGNELALTSLDGLTYPSG